MTALELEIERYERIVKVLDDSISTSKTSRLKAQDKKARREAVAILEQLKQQQCNESNASAPPDGGCRQIQGV